MIWEKTVKSFFLSHDYNLSFQGIRLSSFRGTSQQPEALQQVRLSRRDRLYDLVDFSFVPKWMSR